MSLVAESEAVATARQQSSRGSGGDGDRLEEGRQVRSNELGTVQWVGKGQRLLVNSCRLAQATDPKILHEYDCHSGKEADQGPALGRVESNDASEISYARLISLQP